jgi:hypothetical protein
METRTILRYPNLKTILMVETTLKKTNKLINREQLKRKLPTKMMHQTLNVILEYLKESGKIIDGKKGILWIYNPSPKLEKVISKGVEI